MPMQVPCVRVQEAAGMWNDVPGKEPRVHSTCLTPRGSDCPLHIRELPISVTTSSERGCHVELQAARVPSWMC